MSENLSVKGLTFGSPEYVLIAKRGESLGTFRGKSDHLVEIMDYISLSFDPLRHRDYGNLAYVRDSITDIIGVER